MSVRAISGRVFECVCRICISNIKLCNERHPTDNLGMAIWILPILTRYYMAR